MPDPSPRPTRLRGRRLPGAGPASCRPSTRRRRRRPRRAPGWRARSPWRGGLGGGPGAGRGRLAAAAAGSRVLAALAAASGVLQRALAAALGPALAGFAADSRAASGAAGGLAATRRALGCGAHGLLGGGLGPLGGALRLRGRLSGFAAVPRGPAALGRLRGRRAGAASTQPASHPRRAPSRRASASQQPSAQPSPPRRRRAWTQRLRLLGRRALRGLARRLPGGAPRCGTHLGACESTETRWRTACSMPRACGVSSTSTVWPIRRRPSERSVPS